ncbi:MAG: FimB/Mfa2 family fimbrial subunit [Tannerellaceae bacterium]|nr:FimB/Mfa2 family fimbrial subunit [Tannerellaceae bacterium]
MEQQQTQMSKRFNIVTGWIILLTILFTGCIRDGVRDCEEDTRIRFSFVYDYNAYETDLFAEQVDHISLFIYHTETGKLEEYLEIYRTDMDENHSVSIELPEGRHTAVAWGNCHTEYYHISGHETTASMQLEMTCIENQVMTRANPGSLFHSSNTFEVIRGNEYTVPMSLIKNSNRVKVLIKGLSEEDKQTAESLLVFRMVSNNWRYNFDNSVSSEETIVYIPEYRIEENEEEEEDISVTFYPLRLFTYDEETVLSLRYRNAITGRETVLERALIPYLLKEAATDGADATGRVSATNDEDNEYLDRHDEYEIIFIIEIDAEGNITLDEWDRINQGEELG